MSRESEKKVRKFEECGEIGRIILFIMNSFMRLFKCATYKFSVALPPLCFYMCNQDFFCTKTCVVPLVKPFHLFKLKSVVFIYCCSTEWISHVCA